MPKHRFADRSAAKGRKRTDRQCQWQEGLNQQALSVQVEASGGGGWWRVVVVRREFCSVVYFSRADGKGCINRDPFPLDAICRQSCKPPIHRGSRTKRLVAWRGGTMVWGLRMRFVGLVRLRADRNRLRIVIGGVVKGSGKRFAAREQCGVEPECYPSQHHDHTRRPATTQWPPGPGDFSNNSRR